MEIIQVDPEKVQDNPYQPRRGYSQKKVDEIASSIEQNGLLETPLGRRRNGDVELAFGHIRRRAFVKLKKKSSKKWPTMPVEVREISDREMVVFALEENLKRSDITPIDLARSVTRYFEVFTEATETELADKLSMTQGNISNMRRVMRLPDEILQKIDEGRIIFTMARELLIFEGLSGPGKESRWSRKEATNIDIPKDSKWLMLDAIKNIATPGTEGRYGAHPATVEGMQKAIHDTVKENFRPLGTGSNYGYRSEEALFDVDNFGCKTCELSIKTHPMKSQACLWCTKPECWEKKQEAHKETRAAEAKKKMEEDILRRAAAAEAERQARVSKELAPGKPTEIYVDSKFFTEHVEPSYSGATISEKGSIVKKPFTYEGKQYIATGGCSGVEECYQLMLKDDFKGETRTYSVPQGRDYEEYYESLRNDPNGFYHGMLVKRGKNDCVLVGPEISFISMAKLAAKTISQEIPTEKQRLLNLRKAEAALPAETDFLNEELREPVTAVDQEIEAMAEDIVDYIPEEEREAARERIKHLSGDPRKYPCRTCLSVGRCNGTGVHSVSGVGPTEVLACDDHMGKQDAKKVREKATLKVPTEIMELTKEKAGSRAEVLDINELRAGSYGDLKQGYVLLDNEISKMDNPKECLETCTTGFHYAFDSRPSPYRMTEKENRVSHVCTNPKCVTKKKAAYTRVLNANGQAKKKAEVAAIKQALSETTKLDKPRLKVIIAGLIQAKNAYDYSSDKEIGWFAKRLKIDEKGVPSTGYRADAVPKLKAVIFQELEGLSEEELARVVLEFFLTRLMFAGDIKEYKILTTEALNWLGIGINIEKEACQERQRNE
jgi:ParB/RepB/Spo0J family partition protein